MRRKLRRIVKDVDPEYGDVTYFRAGTTGSYEQFQAGRPRRPTKGRRAAKRRRHQDYYAGVPARPLFHTPADRPERDDPAWQALRDEVLSVGHCAICHSTKSLTVDHIIPVILGGHSFRSNLQCLCRACNKAKGRLLPCDVAA